ncbi:MAG TPA: hypothetical protein VIY48_21935 [Candidatus Paceibacterota bacterium]
MAEQLCQGAEGPNDEPLCEGDDIKLCHVKFWDGSEADVYYCNECRDMARMEGSIVTVK